MLKIKSILEKEEILEYLSSRNLLKQYKKAKEFLLRGNMLQVRFKQRNPKGSGIWYFRINKQFRALCYLNDQNSIVVYKIDNHQSS